MGGRIAALLGIPLVFCLCLASPLHAESVVLEPSLDNMLINHPENLLSNGAGDALCLGIVGNVFPHRLRRVLLRFPVDANVPAGSTIDSVRLTLRMLQSAIIQEAELPTTLHRVTSDWGEGTSDESCRGDTTTNGDATWDFAIFPNVSWSTPGGDYDATVSASHVVPTTAFEYNTWGPTAQMASDVQEWLDDPNHNFGWILIGNEVGEGTNAKRFGSRESGSAENRPQLEIFYTPSTVDVAEPSISNRLQLGPVVPNPADGGATIQFTLPRPGPASVALYDLLGRRVATVLDERRSAGTHSVRLDASRLDVLGPGVYLVQLRFENRQESRKFVVTR